MWHILITCKSLTKCIPTATGFEESRQDRIVLQDIDGGALQLLIDYVYTAEVLVTEENVQVYTHRVLLALTLVTSLCMLVAM